METIKNNTNDMKNYTAKVTVIETNFTYNYSFKSLNDQRAQDFCNYKFNPVGTIVTFTQDID